MRDPSSFALSALDDGGIDALAQPRFDLVLVCGARYDRAQLLDVDLELVEHVRAHAVGAR